MHYNFEQDLHEAARTEEQVAQWFSNEGHEVVELNNDYRYDIKVKLKTGNVVLVEVKEDFMCKKTGNVAVEFQCRGKPSGIDRSEADYYVYKVHTPDDIELLAISKEKLMSLVDTKQYHSIKIGGDTGSETKMYLFDIDTIKKNFKSLTTGDKDETFNNT